MAVATHTPSVWNEVLSTTMHNMHGKLVDNVFRKRPLLEHLLSNGRVRIEDGGYSIVEQLLFNDGQADTYGEWDLINVKPSNAVTAAQFFWKQFFATIAISALEKAQNNGKSQIINVTEAKIKQAEQTLRKKLSGMLYGTYASAVPANDWNSLLTLIDNVAPTGGIDPATEAWWKSYVAAVGAVDAAGLETAMRTAVMTTSDNGGDEVDAIFTDPATYAFYESTLTPQVRYTDTNKANLGFRNLLFENVPLMWDADCPAGTMLGINSEYVGLVIHRDRNFAHSGFTDDLGGNDPGTVAGVAGGGAPAAGAGGLGTTAASALDASVSFITTFGNAVVNNRRRLFKLTGISKAP
jgi:hypothetical protein